MSQKEDYMLFKDLKSGKKFIFKPSGTCEYGLSLVKLSEILVPVSLLKKSNEMGELVVEFRTNVLKIFGLDLPFVNAMFTEDGRTIFVKDEKEVISID